MARFKVFKVHEVWSPDWFGAFHIDNLKFYLLNQICKKETGFLNLRKPVSF